MEHPTWAEIINIFGVFTAVAFSMIGVYIARKAEKKANKAASYLTVDTNLKDVLTVAMNNSNLRNYEEIEKLLNGKDSKLDHVEYDIYAEMCMNLVETIYDEALVDKKNRITYAPTAIWEIILHGEWFAINKNKFQKKFAGFVIEIKNELDNNKSKYDKLSDEKKEQLSDEEKKEMLKNKEEMLKKTIDKICEFIETKPKTYAKEYPEEFHY